MMNSLDNLFQSTYKELYSMEAALVRVQNDILRAINNKELVMLLLLYLSAALILIPPCFFINPDSSTGVSEALYYIAGTKS